ncbi:MAG: hypothetical protein ACD_78C00197G0005 [uncultured bacterium (gcode 4)]|uniref:Methyltransferase type 11 n=1 Tax=uncultured bacterium (gcode 4) TaxID=1234023 RepID=K1XI01_9BACT|nr:MAG: hypothetical protein ACD_78C00197G0005 [uncultured bacterium (gcode 4)]
MNKSCKTCGNESIKIYWLLKKSKFELAYCNRCNSFFLTNNIEDGALKDFYQWFKFNSNKQKQFLKKIADILYIYTYWRKSLFIKSVIQKYTTKKELLDFWWWVWWFSSWLKKVWFNVTMVDYDDESVKVAQNLWIKAHWLWENIWKFPIIFSSHVIEHYTDLNLFFKNIDQHIEDKGIFILSFPNKDCQEFYRKEYVEWYFWLANFAISLEEFKSNPWFCIDPPRHLYALSRETILFLTNKFWYTVLDSFSESSSRENFSCNFIYSIWAVRSIGDIFRNIKYYFSSKKMLKANKYSWNSLVFILQKI